MRAPACVLISIALIAGCGDDGVDVEDPLEVITTVIVELTASGGGAALVSTFDDPDGDGGDPPLIEPIALDATTSYAVIVRFQNRLEAMPEEITDEIRDEGEEHQLFFTGTAVEGPASNQPGAPLLHAYADADAGGLPIGLANTITTMGSGTGELIVTLRHLPPLGDMPTKTADLAEAVRAGGFAAIPGGTDAQVTFPVTVL